MKKTIFVSLMFPLFAIAQVCSDPQIGSHLNSIESLLRQQRYIEAYDKVGQLKERIANQEGAKETYAIQASCEQRQLEFVHIDFKALFPDSFGPGYIFDGIFFSYAPYGNEYAKEFNESSLRDCELFAIQFNDTFRALPKDFQGELFFCGKGKLGATPNETQAELTKVKIANAHLEKIMDPIKMAPGSRGYSECVRIADEHNRLITRGHRHNSL